jgi:hypothetical protein
LARIVIVVSSFGLKVTAGAMKTRLSLVKSTWVSPSRTTPVRRHSTVPSLLAGPPMSNWP